MCLPAPDVPEIVRQVTREEELMRRRKARQRAARILAQDDPMLHLQRLILSTGLGLFALERSVSTDPCDPPIVLEPTTETRVIEKGPGLLVRTEHGLDKE